VRVMTAQTGVPPSIEPDPGATGEPATESAGAPERFVGRSPGQLAWLRLRRDPVAMVSAGLLIFFFLVALGAPLIERLYGVGPRDRFSELLDSRGFPLGYAGGISGDHWFGLTPGVGRDLFIHVVYGLRTSLFIATTSAVLTIVIGVVLGIIAGYLGGVIDAVINWIIDFTLAMPFFIFCMAAVPVVISRFFDPRDEVPPSFRMWLLIVVFALFNWTYTARLVRGQVLSLREREFVEAARAAGAGTGHILFRELLPNLAAPILVTLSLNLPTFITAEAALSFLNIGVVEPTPDLGRLIFDSTTYLRADPAYTLIPGTTLFLLVLAFNLFGDALRDALDPRSGR